MGNKQKTKIIKTKQITSKDLLLSLLSNQKYYKSSSQVSIKSLTMSQLQSNTKISHIKKKKQLSQQSQQLSNFWEIEPTIKLSSQCEDDSNDSNSKKHQETENEFQDNSITSENKLNILHAAEQNKKVYPQNKNYIQKNFDGTSNGKLNFAKGLSTMIQKIAKQTEFQEKQKLCKYMQSILKGSEQEGLESKIQNSLQSQTPKIQIIDKQMKQQSVSSLLKETSLQIQQYSTQEINSKPKNSLSHRNSKFEIQIHLNPLKENKSQHYNNFSPSKTLNQLFKKPQAKNLKYNQFDNNNTCLSRYQTLNQVSSLVDNKEALSPQKKGYLSTQRKFNRIGTFTKSPKFTKEKVFQIKDFSSEKLQYKRFCTLANQKNKL